MDYMIFFDIKTFDHYLWYGNFPVHIGENTVYWGGIRAIITDKQIEALNKKLKDPTLAMFKVPGKKNSFKLLSSGYWANTSNISIAESLRETATKSKRK